MDIRAGLIFAKVLTLERLRICNINRQKNQKEVEQRENVNSISDM